MLSCLVKLLVEMSSASKSFLIKDILSENGEVTSSDESNDTKEDLVTKPIDLRRYFKHPLCPVPLRPSGLLVGKASRSTSAGHRRDTHAHHSPLNALFEMTKNTFDKTDMSKFRGRLLSNPFDSLYGPFDFFQSVPQLIIEIPFKGQVSDMSWPR